MLNSQPRSWFVLINAAMGRAGGWVLSTMTTLQNMVSGTHTPEDDREERQIFERELAHAFIRRFTEEEKVILRALAREFTENNSEADSKTEIQEFPTDSPNDLAYRVLDLTEDPPAHLVCPVLKQIFTDPVRPRNNMLAGAIERSALKYWSQSSNLHPLTKEEFDAEALDTDQILAGEAKQFVAKAVAAKTAEQKQNEVESTTDNPAHDKQTSPDTSAGLKRFGLTSSIQPSSSDPGKILITLST